MELAIEVRILAPEPIFYYEVIMPGSAIEGKDLVKNFVLNNNIHTVLDVGPGEGTYYHALQDCGITQLDGVEIFLPYIDMFHLEEKYNRIFINDIYDFDWGGYGTYDLVILGDVIEHMIEERGRKVISDAAAHARFVVVSLPIYGYEQGPAFGNEHEAHLEQYSDERIREVLKDYEILESFKGEIVGVYIFREGNNFV